MKIDLLYGKEGLPFEVPDGVKATVIRKVPMKVLPDQQRAVREALERPCGGPTLGEIAKGKRSACILICDITRPVPNGTILPPLVEVLEKNGITRDRIKILVATGLHRPNEGEELREIVGDDGIFNSVRIENHFARDKDAHADLGLTSSGTPIMIDRRFVEADVKLVTGLVEPHFMAGYSGGRKVVAPGIAYQDTILRFHTSRILEHCKAVNCVIEGNPLHEEQIQIVRAIGQISALNVVIDEERRIAFVNFGDIETSHLEAVSFMRRHAEVPVPKRFSTIVTTSAGYPLDKTYYQTVKGMVGVIDILKPGGDIIIASRCSEGMGSSDFVEAQRLLCRIGPEAFMKILEGREKAMIDEWQTEMLLKAARVGRIRLFTTGLTDGDTPDLFVERIGSVEDAVLDSIQRHGEREIAVVPEGPYVIPLFAQATG
jgi:nickel-dependent lactate racemase